MLTDLRQLVTRVADLLAQGRSPIDIARELDLDLRAVQTLLASPAFKSQQPRARP